MIKFLVIALIAYIVLNYVRAGLRRRFAEFQNHYQPAPGGQVDAVETVKCPRCGTFVAEGTAHECSAT